MSIAAAMIHGAGEPYPAVTVLASLCSWPVIGLDGDIRVRLWNEAAEALFGWALSEVAGAYPPMAGDHQAALADSLRAALLHRDARMNTAVWKTKSGSSVEVGFRVAQWNLPGGAKPGFMLV
jgi:PAS domain S-box-containing protein